MPRAAGLAEQINNVFGVHAELIEGSSGIYDIKLNGEMIYSRHANDNQFPESHESVIELIKEAQ